MALPSLFTCFKGICTCKLLRLLFTWRKPGKTMAFLQIIAPLAKPKSQHVYNGVVESNHDLLCNIMQMMLNLILFLVKVILAAHVVQNSPALTTTFLSIEVR